MLRTELRSGGSSVPNEFMMSASSLGETNQSERGQPIAYRSLVLGSIVLWASLLAHGESISEIER